MASKSSLPESTAMIIAAIISGIFLLAGVLLAHYLQQKDGNRKLPMVLTANPTVTITQVLSGGELDNVLLKIQPGNGGIQKGAPWWKEVSSGLHSDGEYNPSSLPGGPECFGVAWNVEGFACTSFVFERTQYLKFQNGGWYAQVCISNGLTLTPDQVAAIQKNWLEKSYSKDCPTWIVNVLDH